MPATIAEARPIALGTDLGYVTVGESVDPEDWERPGADEIVRRVKEEGSDSEEMSSCCTTAEAIAARPSAALPANSRLSSKNGRIQRFRQECSLASSRDKLHASVWSRVPRSIPIAYFRMPG